MKNVILKNVLYLVVVTITFLLTTSPIETLAKTSDFPFKNIQQIKKQLGFDTKYESSPKRQLKVAILDKGFLGYEEEIGVTLPAGTQYIEGPIEPPADLKVEHGLKMAQIFTALLTDNLQAEDWVPELYLYNVYGFTNFKTAVEDLISKKVDIVLYSEVWEYGGNNDGSGFINFEVNKAIENGILWVNAAGNFQQTTFNSRIKTGNENWVILPDQNQSLKIQCQAQEDQKCDIKVVLSWNDFKDDVELGTDKDLDLALTDDLLTIIQTSALKQSDDPKEERPGYSKYPREILTAQVDRGTYFIRVKNRSLNFGQKDLLRITVNGEDVLMPSHTKDESVLNPADNPEVITVGASDSDRSSVSKKMNKPDIMSPSSIVLENGDEMRGSSNAAAFVAAGVAITKGLYPQIGREKILSKISRVQESWDQPGLSLRLLGFLPTGPGCFYEAQFPNIPDYMQDVLDQGGVLVATNMGARIMVPYDPIQLAPNLRRVQINDLILVTPNGFQLYPRYSMVPNGFVEVFQRPLEATLCTPPDESNTAQRHFHL